MGEIIEIGYQQWVIVAALGFENPEEAIEEILAKYRYLTAREFSYVDNKGVRRFNSDGMLQLLRKADNPFAVKLREFVYGDLTEEEAKEIAEELQAVQKVYWDKRFAEQERQLKETEQELERLKSMRRDANE